MIQRHLTPQRQVPKEAHLHLNQRQTNLFPRRNLEEDDSADLRFHVECQLTNVNGTMRSLLQDTIFPAALAALKLRLKMRKPVQGRLFLPRWCNSFYPDNNKCHAVLDLGTCGDFEGAPTHNASYFGPYETCDCSSTTSCSCANHQGGSGLVDKDVVVYVTADERALPCSSNAIAIGGHCLQDMEDMRPVAVFVNFCTSQLLKMDYRSLVGVTVHEMLHGLFFSDELFKSYIDDEGKILDGVSDGTNIITPQVLAAARRQLGCAESSMKGAALENEGGAGTQGSHWEQRLFNTELMTGVMGTAGAIFSNLTLALGHDSGCYVPKYEQASHLSWGFEAGCTFAGGACSDSRFYCNKINDIGCSFGNDAVGTCTAPPLMNSCKIFQPFANEQCELSGQEDKGASKVTGQHFGANGRCILSGEAIWQRKKITPEGEMLVSWTEQAGCYKISPMPRTSLRGMTTAVLSVPQSGAPREDTRYAMLTGLGNSLSRYIMLADKGSHRRITAWVVYPRQVSCWDDNPPQVHITFEGKIGPCPSANFICPTLGCPKDCNGHGVCYNSTCQCFPGFVGTDCAPQYPIIPEAVNSPPPIQPSSSPKWQIPSPIYPTSATHSPLPFTIPPPPQDVNSSSPPPPHPLSLSPTTTSQGNNSTTRLAVYGSVDDATL
ncbi:hypothetical protein CYMTET_41858 [Cymbomonas tetramitiformis]|uniref:EGF-like domain-containing protein n=1 Tax=Cymbomonas tetramitiformis TaxID=36881 RepID=A0AAE0C6C4_9CHLO|nr:hypothetical protein CYMTET_41858 [Cymbomonas tetramitiformis]